MKTTKILYLLAIVCSLHTEQNCSIGGTARKLPRKKCLAYLSRPKDQDAAIAAQLVFEFATNCASNFLFHGRVCDSGSQGEKG